MNGTESALLPKNDDGNSTRSDRTDRSKNNNDHNCLYATKKKKIKYYHRRRISTIIIRMYLFHKIFQWRSIYCARIYYTHILHLLLLLLVFEACCTTKQ